MTPTLEGHSSSVYGVAVTTDGKRVVSASEDKTLKVWDLGSGAPLATFTCDGASYSCAGCRLLITTREGNLATALAAQEQRVDVLSDETALKLLAEWAEMPLGSLPDEARMVARECGNLPFVLALAGAMARDGTTWSDLLEARLHVDLTFLAKKLPNYPYLDVLKCLRVSVDFVGLTDPAGVQHYLELAVFPAERVPETAVLTLWTHTDGFSEVRARELLTTLHRKALVQTLEGEAPNRRVGLHDLQRDYVRVAQEDLQGLHEEYERFPIRILTSRWDVGPKVIERFMEPLKNFLAGNRQKVRKMRVWFLHFGLPSPPFWWCQKQ